MNYRKPKMTRIGRLRVRVADHVPEARERTGPTPKQRKVRTVFLGTKTLTRILPRGH